MGSTPTQGTSFSLHNQSLGCSGSLGLRLSLDCPLFVDPDFDARAFGQGIALQDDDALAYDPVEFMS